MLACRQTSQALACSLTLLPAHLFRQTSTGNHLPLCQLLPALIVADLSVILGNWLADLVSARGRVDLCRRVPARIGSADVHKLGLCLHAHAAVRWPPPWPGVKDSRYTTTCGTVNSESLNLFCGAPGECCMGVVEREGRLSRLPRRAPKVDWCGDQLAGLCAPKPCYHIRGPGSQVQSTCAPIHIHLSAISCISISIIL